MKKRVVGLDIYRLICMFLITTIHIIGYSDLSTTVNYTHYNFYVVNLIKTFQTFAVSGFVLISAYFLISSNTTTKKIVSFWLQVIFYSCVILLVSLTFSSSISIINLVKSFFPILSNHYWYPVNYLVLLFLVPILNKFVYSLNKTEYRSLIVMIFLICTLFQLNPFFNANIYLGHQSHGIIWFIFLYFIAGYIKIYGLSNRLFGVSTFILSGICLYVLILIDNNLFNLKENYKFIGTIFNKVDLLSYNSLIPIIFTVSSFNVFTTIKKFDKSCGNKVFSNIISATFGVYLIQEHCLIREILWDSINISKWGQSPFLILIIFLIFIALMFFAILIYGLYRLFEKIFIFRIEEKILKLIEKIKLRIQKNKNTL